MWKSLKIPNEFWEIIQDFVSMSEKCSKIDQECVQKLFWPNAFTTNTLGVTVYKTFKCDKSKVPYCNV